MGALKAGCERAREWVSLELDEELSELGRARLRVHLERCPSCRLYAREADAVAKELRAAAEEEPTVPVILAVPGRRRRAGLFRGAIAAAAVAAVAVVVGLTGSLPTQAPARHTAKAPYFEHQLLIIASQRHDVINAF